jgi:hypothetical protein
MTAQVIVSTHNPPERRPALFALFAIVVGLAVAGAVLAPAALIGAGHSEGRSSSILAVGTPATTSFGSLTIERVQTIAGLDPSVFDNGMAHGIQGLVPTTEAQIQVSVSLVNSSDAPAKLDPRQFQLRVEGVADPVLVTGSTLMAVALPPKADIDATLTFVAPRGGARMSVEFLEMGQNALISIPVGQLDQAPPDAGQHSH